ncbi:MAG TPA: hypothetical protein VGE21_08490 [Flavobacteriales bacterium]
MTWHGTAPYTGHTGAVYAVVPVPGQRAFYSAGGDGLVVRWALDGPAVGTPVARLDRAIFSLQALSGGRYLILGDEDGGLHRVDLQHQREDHFSRPHKKGIFRSITLADGRLAVAGGDGELGIWTGGATEFRCIRQIPLSTGKLRDLALSPLGSVLAVACGDGSVRSLDSVHFNELRTITAHARGATSVAWHPTKPVLVSGGKDGVLCCWPNRGDDRPLLSIQAHTGAIYGMAFSADGRLCATSGRDGNVKLWDAHSFDPITRFERRRGGHDRSVNACAWVQDRLVTASDDGTLRGWMEP